MINKILPFVYLLFVLASCSAPPEEQADSETLYRTHCGNCHLAPDPANIPKTIWADQVLPVMAARLGYKFKNYNPYARNSIREKMHIERSNTYPKEPLIDKAQWEKIHAYVMALAPDSIPIEVSRSERNSDLFHFEPIPVSLVENQLVGVTNIQFEASSKQFMIGDAKGGFYQWPVPLDGIQRFSSPLISYHQKGKDFYYTEIGFMNPSENPLGTLYRKRPGSVDTLARKLHRPVYSEIVDLNEDGEDEILICEFGNLTGELSLLVPSNSSFEKRTLLALPGTIKVEITDMDNNGKKDIVVLASQGNEGIFILYQQEKLQFKLDQVIKLPPEFGSSWFQLIDYNGDQQLDIVLVNGDNADFSIFLKPFHGLRLYLNQGENSFAEKWFYPIYGATRVLGEDYDLDGDLDFAVMSFFPDYENTPEESFVFLENKDPLQFLFEPFTFQEAMNGRWMVMEDGDYDQDGDIDIMLGSFLLPPGKQHKSIIDHWRNETVDLLLLKNKAVQ